jgi:hypothetical protein
MTHYEPRKSKRDMIAALDATPTSCKLIDHNTIEYVDAAGDTHTKLHDTVILTVHKRGGFTVNTGGWNTITTRDRLNKFLPSGNQVYTEKGVIHLNGTPFRETITIGPRGAITPDWTPAKIDRDLKAIKKYVDLYRTQGLPPIEKSAGDPWVFGEVDESVMRDWMESGYRFRRMIPLALAAAGMQEQGVAFYMHDIDRDNGKIDSCTLGRIRRYVRKQLGV